MTAATNTTKVPLSPLVMIMLTLAAASTASAGVGFWFADHRRRPRPPRNIADEFAALDRRELDELEERLRRTDW